jgi:FkbM family methyltransferase
MSAASLSAHVLSATDQWPATMKLITWLWAHSYAIKPREEHWLFRRLRRQFRVDVSRTVRLRTGEWCSVDPFDYIGGEIARHGYYEAETIELFLGVLEPGMVVFDAGAHVGQYSLISSTVVGAGGHVYSFEPEPRNYARLARNITMNRRDNVTAVNCALSDAPSHLRFHLAIASNSGGHSLAPTVCSSADTIMVEATTIDTYVARQNITRIDFLKADVEGAELPLLRGAQESIKRFRPVLVVEGSIHSKGFGYDTSELAQFIESNGYQVFLVDEHGLTPRPREWPPREFFNMLGIPIERIERLTSRLGLPSVTPQNAMDETASVAGHDR